MVTRRLFTHLIDDAALFPPGNAPMAVGVRDHHTYEQAWYHDVVGPFLCSDARLGELGGAVAARPERAGALPVAVVVSGGAETVGGAVAAVTQHERLRLAWLEVPAAPGDADTAIAAIAEAAVTAGAGDRPLFAEIPREDMDADRGIAAAARHGLHAKLRTGGEAAGAFPDEREVAAFMLSCLTHGVQFKCTAGLHTAVRHTAPDTGFEHHGFLNLLLAVRIALEGGDRSAVAAALADRDESEVVRRVAHLDEVAATAVRAWLRSYGSCSIIEPVDELVRLGLLRSPAES
jgi:hypothetical protein